MGIATRREFLASAVGTIGCFAVGTAWAKETTSPYDLVAATEATAFEMRGRPAAGWLRVASDHVGTKRQLTRWVQLGTAYARTLPAKR